jgi:uncharacterized DUF497 family protein
MKDVAWGEAKRLSNIAKHGIDFNDVVPCFQSSGRLVFQDVRKDYGEKRFHKLCPIGNRLLHIVFTECQDHYRVISAWKANERDQRTYERGKDDKGGSDH